MGKPTGFKEFPRELPSKKSVKERVSDFKEIYQPFPIEKLRQQTARCMDCGVPTCHAGCPLGNLIPDFNDFAYNDLMKQAIDQLHRTNNFPEFTGRLCPAPCEEACVLSINEPPVTIELIEKEIIEYAFAQGWVIPLPPKQRTGKTVAVVGSGPAGLACAAQLNAAGHQVTVFERADRIGGLLRYGIPDFKLEKWVIDRRLKILEQEGISFKTNAHIGVNVPIAALNSFDAVVICIGATVPRDLKLPGRDLSGIHYAMDFLTQQNQQIAGSGKTEAGNRILATDKHVIVIGGGDTGSDCVGTCHRQRAKSVTNFELFAKPPEQRNDTMPWPFWPMRMRTSASHEEGGLRLWNIMTKSFDGRDGHIRHLTTIQIDLEQGPDGKPLIKEIAGTEKKWQADLVLLALGFNGVEPNTLIAQYNLELTPNHTIQTDGTYMTSQKGIFSAGDAQKGQSLIVWAISEGREAAYFVDKFLMGDSNLPRKGGGDLPRQ